MSFETIGFFDFQNRYFSLTQLQPISRMTLGIEIFRNTGFGDIMEMTGIWQYPSNFQSVKSKENTENEPGKENESAEGQAERMSFHSGTNAEMPLDESSIETVDPYLVCWSGSNDSEHPQNMSAFRKISQIAQVMLLTSVTYAGASIYTSGQDAFQKDMKIGHVAGTLPLSIYFLGFGLGPVIFSPLSEVASFGRNKIYLTTLLISALFQIGTALAPDLGTELFFRFVTGVFCSPALATGGASIGDIVHPQKLGACLSAWALGAVAAPALAPLLGAAMYVAVNWRFIFWFLMICASFTFLLMFFMFKESLASNILHRRAQRVRRETGDHRYYTKYEKLDSEVSLISFSRELLLRPMIIQFSEPGVLAFNTYIALVYGAFYLFFEAFPIVFVEIYHFTDIENGVAFMGFVIGCVFALLILLSFMKFFIAPAFAKGTFEPEQFLKLPMMVSWLLPASLFFFGWTAQIHWILPIISEIFFLISFFNIFQGIFAYLSSSYPRYLASVFAANGFMRAVFACSFPLFGRAMYKNLGSQKFPLGWGSSLIGFFTAALATLPFIFYHYGAHLRGRSKYAN